MKRITLNTYICLLLAILFSACRQEDLQVTPVGKPLAYSGPSKTVRQLMDSAGLTIYKAAWEQVNMDSVIAGKKLQAYTLLAPSDAAFAAAGITAANIGSTPVAVLDTIMLYHTMDTWLSPGQLKALQGNMTMTSLLTRADFADFRSYSPYICYQFLGFHEGKLMVNGKPHPLTALEGIDGTIYVLDEVQPKPDQDMIDYLQNNPNFTFFMEACRLSDSLYDDMWLNQGFTDMLTTQQSSPKPITLLAPTNHAFQQAGINTFDDLRELALRYPVDWPHYNDEWYYVPVYTSLDSLLMLHKLDFSMAARPQGPVVIFSNDMTDNPSLTNFLITSGGRYQSPPHYIRLAFSTSGGQIMVKQEGNNTAPARTVTATSPLFRNGVIHVIDDGLIVP